MEYKDILYSLRFLLIVMNVLHVFDTSACVVLERDLRDASLRNITMMILNVIALIAFVRCRSNAI